MFHTCEHAYTIPELAKTVSDAGLEIREFGISETVRAKFHGLGFTDVTDLKAWEKAEYLRPGLFSKMYVLKVGHAHG